MLNYTFNLIKFDYINLYIGVLKKYNSDLINSISEYNNTNNSTELTEFDKNMYSNKYVKRRVSFQDTLLKSTTNNGVIKNNNINNNDDNNNDNNQILVNYNNDNKVKKKKKSLRKRLSRAIVKSISYFNRDKLKNKYN